MIYLDNAATSFPKPEEVYQEVNKYLRIYGANPGRSGHKAALQAGRVIFETRELLAQLFHIDDPMRIVFTNNATTALNFAIKGFLKTGDHVILTSMEHNSVIRPIKALEQSGVIYSIVRCNRQGMLNTDDLEVEIKNNTRLIVATHASNVTGTLMPIEKIGKIAKKRGIALLLDASQTAGVYDIDVHRMNIDMLAFPGHKSLLGPQGTGGLYIKKGLDVRELINGGTGSKSDLIEQPDMIPDRYESGTLNTPGIAGLGAGVKYILGTGMDKIREHEKNLTQYMLEQLEGIKKVTVYGPKDVNKQASVISINIDNADSSEVSHLLDNKYDIAVRPGLHCSPLAHETIGTLQKGTVRFSIGLYNTQEDIECAVKAIKDICNF